MQATATCVCGELVERVIAPVDRVLGLGTVQATCPRCGWHLNARAFGFALHEVRERDGDATVAGVYAVSPDDALAVLADVQGVTPAELASVYALPVAAALRG